MADDIIQRRMSAEEEANLHQQIRDFSHTIQPSTPSGSDMVANAVDPTALTTSGQSIHAELLRRAEQKAHLDTSLGENSRFRDYKTSMVGARGQDKELRRDMALIQKKDRVAREARFGGRKDPRGHRRVGTSSADRRQGFNATGTTDTEHAHSSTDRQSYNAQPTEQPHPNIGFREPQSRGYDPFK